VVGNGVGNSLNNQGFLDNTGQSAVLGGFTGGIAGTGANVLSSVGPGRPPAATLINGGVKSMRELDNHSVGEAINGVLCFSLDCR
jgi:hypothetical protein